MIKYTLTSRGRSVKTPTSPTFELASTDLKVVLKMFEDCVCDICKTKREEAKQIVDEFYFVNNKYLEFSEEDYEKDLKESLDESLPDNYNDLTDEEKINILLNTQCGAEFIFETVEDLEVV